MKRTILLVFLFFNLVISIFSREATSLNELLYQPIENCEEVAVNSQDQLIKLEFYETDRINQILEVWSAECGEEEPIHRMRILIAINQKQLVQSDYEHYVKNHIEIFKDRVSIAQDADYQEVSESHKGYFSYVPLKSAFDARTKEIASQLLPLQEAGSAAYTLALLFTEEVDKFDDEISSTDNELFDGIIEESSEDFEEVRPRFGLETGWWMPGQELSEFFGQSPYLGMNAGFSFNEIWRADINLLLIFLINDDPYRVNIEDSIQQTDSDLLFSINLSLTRTQHLGKAIFFDGTVGFGVNGMNTDIPQFEPTEDNEYYTLVTFDFNVGIGIRKQVFRQQSLGIKCTYHYAPYGLDKRLVDVFGDQSVRLGITYLF